MEVPPTRVSRRATSTTLNATQDFRRLEVASHLGEVKENLTLERSRLPSQTVPGIQKVPFWVAIFDVKVASKIARAVWKIDYVDVTSIGDSRGPRILGVRFTPGAVDGPSVSERLRRPDAPGESETKYIGRGAFVQFSARRRSRLYI